MPKPFIAPPAKPIVATAHVIAVEETYVSKKGQGNYLVTPFVLEVNEPAVDEVGRAGKNLQNGQFRTYLTWVPAWIRPEFEPGAYTKRIEELKALAAEGDTEAGAEAKTLSGYLTLAPKNWVGEFKKGRVTISMLMGLVGGASEEEHSAAWGALNAEVDALGAANPTQDDPTSEQQAQDNIIAGIADIFARHFGPDGLCGKFVGIQYGTENVIQKDAEGNPLRDSEGKAIWAPSAYRSVMQWFIPTQKELQSRYDYAQKSGKVTFLVDF